MAQFCWPLTVAVYKGQTAQELGLQNGKLVNIDFSDDLKEIRSVQILQNLHSFY